jgi:lipopolysaccharide heptosyltransferase II
LNILLIQILRLGDALQLTPILSGLKEVMPQANLSVLTSSLGKQIFSRHPAVERVIELPKTELIDLIATSKTDHLLSALDILDKALRPVLEQEWDWVINFSYSFPSALLCYIADGAYCSGFFATQNRQYFSKENWLAYCISAFVNRKYSIFNWVDINKNIVNLPSVPATPHFPLRDEEISRATSHLEKIGFNGEKIIGMHPGASGDHKCWPLDKFAALGHALANELQCKILIFGDGNETQLGRQLRESIGPACEDLTGKTTLEELAAYLSRCHLLVSNDTGPAHMASAVKTPVIGLFFNTHFVETGPFGPGNVAIYPDIDCFPCQSTLACSHRKCLEYIHPGTVESVVCGYDDFLRNGNHISVREEDRPVALNISGFDPWGNMEWRPLDRRPLKAGDILHLIYKTFWLSALKDEPDMEHALSQYISDHVERFGHIELQDPDKTLLSGIGENLTALADLYADAWRLSTELFDAMGKGDSQAINRLGDALQKREDDISLIAEDASLNPVIEYLALKRDNIFEFDLARLSIKTAALYQEARALTLGLKRHTENVMAHLAGKQK